MRHKAILGTVAVIAVAGVLIHFSGNLALVATRDVIFTEAELNACAAEAAFQQYLKQDNGDSAQAAASLAVDGYSNILGEARAYRARFSGVGLKTVFEEWAEAAPGICLKHKLAGETVRMPNYDVPGGYHIVRDPLGGAAEVKDGDPAPTFDCMAGYHYAGFPAQPSGAGGCQPDRP